MKKKQIQTPSISDAEAEIRLWKKYYNDPVRFAYEFCGVQRLDLWQKETLMALAGKPIDGQDAKRLVAVAGGAGVGKEVVCAIAIMWFLLTRPNCTVAAMSASAQQVQVALWQELKRWIDKSPYLQEKLEWTPSTIQVRGFGATWRAYQSIAAKRISASGEADVEGGAGMHNKHMLIVISEASGVDDAQIAAKLATLTGGEDNRLLMVGNPVRRSGFFFRSFMDPKVRPYWWIRNVSHLESTFTSQDDAKRLIDMYGEDSAIVQAKVFGQFPKGDDGNTIFSYDEVEAAFTRNIEDKIELPLQIGVDSAREGDDETVVYCRRGKFVFPPIIKSKTTLMDICSIVVEEATRRWMRPKDDPRKGSWNLTPQEFAQCQKDTLVVVDDAGFGGGVTDALKAQGWRVYGLNHSFRARNARHYKSRGDEVWFVDGKIALNECYVPRDLTLMAQLCSRESKFDQATGTKRRLETKDELARRNLSSPDRADALMLCFASVGSIDAMDFRKAFTFI